MVTDKIRNVVFEVAPFIQDYFLMCLLLPIVDCCAIYSDINIDLVTVTPSPSLLRQSYDSFVSFVNFLVYISLIYSQDQDYLNTAWQLPLFTPTHSVFHQTVYKLAVRNCDEIATKYEEAKYGSKKL